MEIASTILTHTIAALYTAALGAMMPVTLGGASWFWSGLPKPSGRMFPLPAPRGAAIGITTGMALSAAGTALWLNHMAVNGHPGSIIAAGIAGGIMGTTTGAGLVIHEIRRLSTPPPG